MGGVGWNERARAVPDGVAVGLSAEGAVASGGAAATQGDAPALQWSWPGQVGAGQLPHGCSGAPTVVPGTASGNGVAAGTVGVAVAAGSSQWP